MKESDGEEVATHTGPESCGAAREGGAEASTGVRAGQVFSRERNTLRDADAVKESGRQHRSRRDRETRPDPARSQTLCTCGITMHGSREIPGSPAGDGTAGRIGKPQGTSR